MFSQKVMGDGIAIRPLDSVIQAPADGTVTVVMKETAHACGITLDNGMELLIHVGIDTVELGGEGFEILVEEGQSVTCGTPLIRFDRQKIKAAGYQDTVMLNRDRRRECKKYQDADRYAGKSRKDGNNFLSIGGCRDEQRFQKEYRLSDLSKVFS